LKRILFDTSVYGRLISEPEILEKIKSKYKEEFIIYGCSTIRKELKETPKHIVHGKKKVQIELLNIYDSFIIKENHDLKYNKFVESLTLDYIKEYKKNKGTFSYASLKEDFAIIATATIYQLEIIISDDKRTMFSSSAIKSYKNVNRRHGLSDPEFKDYEKFRQEL